LILGADSLDLEVWRFQMDIRQQKHVHVLPLLDLENGPAFLVEQEGGYVHGKLCEDALGVLLHRLFLDDSKDGKRQGFDAADRALTLAARTDQLAGLAEGRPQTLA
jgi:hypothetical protein